MGATKTGSGWQEGIDKATTRPPQTVMTNDKGVRQMVMAVSKRARNARAMVMTMRMPVDEEGKGGTGHGVGNEGGVQRRGRVDGHAKLRAKQRTQESEPTMRATTSNKPHMCVTSHMGPITSRMDPTKDPTKDPTRIPPRDVQGIPQRINKGLEMIRGILESSHNFNIISELNVILAIQ